MDHYLAMKVNQTITEQCNMKYYYKVLSKRCQSQEFYCINTYLYSINIFIQYKCLYKISVYCINTCKIKNRQNYLAKVIIFAAKGEPDWK